MLEKYTVEVEVVGDDGLKLIDEVTQAGFEDASEDESVLVLLEVKELSGEGNLVEDGVDEQLVDGPEELLN